MVKYILGVFVVVLLSSCGSEAAKEKQSHGSIGDVERVEKTKVPVNKFRHTQLVCTKANPKLIGQIVRVGWYEGGWRYLVRFPNDLRNYHWFWPYEIQKASVK